MVEHRLLRQDGTTFEGEAQARVILWGTREVRVTAVRDITGRKRAEQLTAMEMKVLEMIARGQPLTETLNTLLRLVESQSPELLCSVLLLAPDGTQLRHAAAPSLPADFVTCVDGLVTGPQSGSCGTAAFRREPVLVADIATDPLWTDYKQFALAHGLRACWSTPIFDAQRHVLGTFAIYHRLPGLPHERDLRLIDMATHTAAICISNHRAEEALRESEEKFSKAFRSNPNGICITEMATGRYLELNESFCRVFGYTQPEMIGRTALEVGVWANPADRERLIRPVRRHGSVRDLQLQTRDRAGRVKILMVSAELIELRGRECLVCMLHDITSRVQAEQERSEAEQREAQARAEYTLQLIAYQEAERKRIAGELHDSLGQNLLLIKNRARLALTKASQPAEMRDQLDHISELVTTCLAEVRQISRDLHPYQLEHLGLTRSLETLVDNLAQASAVKCQRKFEPVDDLFTGEAATSLYRIVQESLNNILKHSQAGHVKLGLERDIHEVTLRIEDDGCGFQTGRAGKGLGLKNIGERVRMLGGRCQIVSQPGQGTRIAVTIPIPAELP
jgi:PAS domain S-box-containing protein